MAAAIQLLITAQRRFVANVSHELGAPLARMPLALAPSPRQFAEKNRAEPARREHETGKLSSLVQQLLLRAGLEVARAQGNSGARLFRLRGHRVAPGSNSSGMSQSCARCHRQCRSECDPRCACGHADSSRLQYRWRYKRDGYPWATRATRRMSCLGSRRLSLAPCSASFNLAAERQSKSYCGRANAT